MDSEIPVIAFSANGTKNTDAFVVINTNLKNEKPVTINLKGTQGRRFKVYRTAGGENYKEAGIVEIPESGYDYKAPANSATTFFAVN